MKTIVLWFLWNVQNQHIAERERSTRVVVLISGAFVRSRLIYERCLHLSDTPAHHSAHNNLFLTLRVIHMFKRELNAKAITITCHEYHVARQKGSSARLCDDRRMYCWDTSNRRTVFWMANWNPQPVTVLVAATDHVTYGGTGRGKRQWRELNHKNKI